MSDFERTYETLDLDNPPLLANENDTHWLFFCPNCQAKRGKADDKGKLYFDKTQHKGLCFLCNTAFYPEKQGEFEEKAENILAKSVDSVTKILEPYQFKDPAPINFSFGDLDKEHLNYLKSRHIFLPMLAPYLGLKGWKGSKNGIVVPYLYKDYVATFQVRYDTTDPKARYYIPSGTDKILYSPEHLLTKFKLSNKEGKITIVEGWADAIAAWIMGFPHPMAVQGSMLTELQSHLLRKFVPFEAYVIMDDWDKSKNVCKDLRKKIPSITNTQIINFGNDVDPEEHLKEEMKNPEKMRLYFGHVMQLIRERMPTNDIQ